MNNSLKSKVKQWVYFLRLAHLSSDPEIQENLKKSSFFYKDWGNYQTGSFDVWWREHSHLFKDESKLKVLESGEIVQNGMFTIQFPFTYAPTTASKIFKDMYQREFDKQRIGTSKIKKIYGGFFELKPNDFQVSQFEYYLKFCKEVYLPLMSVDKKPKLKDFVEIAVLRFKEKIKRTSSRRIPFTNSTSTYEVQRRLATRYKTYSYNLMRNASLGIFPGDYEEQSIKNQVEKRKIEYPIRKFSKGVPRSKSEVYNSRESGFDMYAKRRKQQK